MRGVRTPLCSTFRCPGWTGAVAREIRRLQFAPAPVLVAVTALTSPSSRPNQSRSGFDHHFVKPADLLAVLAVIVDRTGPGATDHS